jgi:hypothetical protein
MIRWLLTAAALGCFALGLLTCVRTPDWLSWKFTLLAGEFGHWLAGAALAAGLAAWGWRGEHVALGGVAPRSGGR